VNPPTGTSLTWVFGVKETPPFVDFAK